MYTFIFTKYTFGWQVMPRLRIGIGRPSGQTSVERHVLGRFSQEEQKVLDSVMKQSLDVLLMHLTDSQSQSSPAEGSRASRKRKERTRSPAQDDTTEQNPKWHQYMIFTIHSVFKVDFVRLQIVVYVRETMLLKYFCLLKSNKCYLKTLFENLIKMRNATSGIN